MSDRPKSAADGDYNEDEISVDDERKLAECEAILEKGRIVVEFDESLEGWDDFEYALIDYLEILSRMGRHQEVVDAYFKFKDTEWPVVSAYRTNLVQPMMEAGRYSEAIRLLEDEAPNRDEHVLLAEAYDAVGRHEEALKVRQKIQQIDAMTNVEMSKVFSLITERGPDDHLAYEGLSKNLANLQDYPGAIKAIREAIRLDPECQRYQDRLAEYERELEQKKSGN